MGEDVEKGTSITAKRASITNTFSPPLQVVHDRQGVYSISHLLTNGPLEFTPYLSNGLTLEDAPTFDFESIIQSSLQDAFQKTYLNFIC